MRNDANAQMIDRFHHEVWNERVLRLIDERIADAYVGHTPDGELEGSDGFRRYVELTHRQYPDLVFSGEVVAVDGDRVVTMWTVRGTYAGGDPALPDTVIGKGMVLSGIGIERVVAGQIVESWDMWDRLGVLQQFGLI